MKDIPAAIDPTVINLFLENKRACIQALKRSIATNVYFRF